MESPSTGALNSVGRWRSWLPRLAAVLALFAVAEAVGILLISSGGNRA